MAIFTRQQGQEMFKKAEEQGLSREIIFKQAIAQGHSFEGLDTNQVMSELGGTSEKPKKSMGEKVLDVTGGKELAQGLGQSLANSGFAKKGLKIGNKTLIQSGGDINKSIENVQSDQIQIQEQLLKRIKEKKARGEDASRLEGALADINDEIKRTGEGANKLLNPNEITNKQVLGDALQLATTAGGAKLTSGLVGSASSATTGFVSGLAQGAKAGAIGGGAVGALTGASQALQEDKNLGGIVTDTVIGAGIGGVTGGVLGGITGGISGGLKGRALRKEILGEQVKSGEKTINQTQKAQKVKSMAKEQGFDDIDIDFIQSMKPTDRKKAQKMITLAQEASVNKRAIERPIDIVGDSMVDRVKFIRNKNSIAGKAVDTTAKALKGQKVDSTPIRDRALALLEDAGVTANPDGTPNWSKSIFNKTPDLKNKIMKSLSDLPAGEIDAYDLHNFKKSIDEVVNYGVKGEGLKGKSASILKAIRTSADEVLDSNFDSYNKANTDYKVTRDILDITDDLFGKKAGVVKERGGQLLRSVFSNNTQRPRVLSLIEQLDKISKKYGGKFDDNLLDQAIFTEILEDVYGTQATTSLQGQTARAIKGTQKVIEGLRNPVQGAGELLSTTAEKLTGISPERKKKILEALIRN